LRTRFPSEAPLSGLDLGDDLGGWGPDGGLVTAVLGAGRVACKDGTFLGFSLGGTAADTSVVGFERARGFGEARAKDGRVGAGVMLPAITEVAKTG
jgi:hypothetical protein